MSHDKETYEEQLTLFSLGLLTGYEKRMLEEHLGTGCEICLQALRENEQVLSSLAYSLDDSPLPLGIESKIFEKIEEQEKAPLKPKAPGFWSSIRPMWLNLGSAVAVGLLIILFLNNMSLRNELSQQGQNLSNLQASLGEEPEIMEYVMNPRVDTISLQSGMPELNTSGKLLWETGNKEALLAVSNIPALKEGQIYQFWVVENGEPHSMGTFTVGADGSKMIEIHCMPEHGGEMQFVVTLEPEGGMPLPTGDTYLVGSL